MLALLRRLLSPKPPQEKRLTQLHALYGDMPPVRGAAVQEVPPASPVPLPVVRVEHRAFLDFQREGFATATTAFGSSPVPAEGTAVLLASSYAISPELDGVPATVYRKLSPGTATFTKVTRKP